MKLIVGLGNPGPEYDLTRHNVGFLVVDTFVKDIAKVKWQSRPVGKLAQSKSLEAAFLKPQTYMNESGRAVARATGEFSIHAASELLVVVDDADLPLGSLRLRAKGSDGGHRGLKSLIEHLGTCDFARLRIGIGRPENKTNALRDFVLEPFSASEKTTLQTILNQACQLTEIWLKSDLKAALACFSQISAKGVRK